MPIQVYCANLIHVSVSGKKLFLRLTDLIKLRSVTGAREEGELIHAIEALCTRRARVRSPTQLSEWIIGVSIVSL